MHQVLTKHSRHNTNNLSGMTEVHENNQAPHSIPEWASFFLKTGYDMPTNSGHRRRIILISMPCNSAAPALLALGAMMRDLEREGADEENLHRDSLLAYAKQYLEQDPEPEKQKLDGKIRKVNPAGGHPLSYTISDSTDFETGELALIMPKGCILRPNPDLLYEYYIGGNPPAMMNGEGNALNRDDYKGIIPDLSIKEQNLSRSFSGVVLAGKDNYEAKKQCSRISFVNNTGKHSLTDLITIQGWSQGPRISRVAFFNGRTGRIDRVSHIRPRLVVADLDSTFHKVIESEDFRTSDIVGVMDRSHMDRYAIDSIRQRMTGLEDYYSEDNAFINSLTDVPAGISIRALIK